VIRRAEARKKGLGKRAEAADYWRRYLANDCQAEWAARARRSLKFCEMQVRLTASARRPPLARNALKATGQNRKRELRAARSVARHY
jgi:hypothetical protein